MQTDFLSLIQLQTPKFSGNEASPLLGKSSGGDGGFEAMLKNFLGASQESNAIVASSTPAPPLPFQQASQTQTVTGKVNSYAINRLQELLEKINDVLRQQKMPLTFEEANFLLQNALTDEEHAYMKQILQDTARWVSRMSKAELQAGHLPEQSAIASSLQELSALFAGISVSPTNTITSQTVPQPDDQIGFQNTLLSDPENSLEVAPAVPQISDNTSSNTLQLLAQLYDQLKQIAALSVVTQQQHSPGAPATTVLPNTATQTSSPPSQQAILQNLFLQTGRSPQIPAPQADTGQQFSLFESGDTDGKLLQQLFEQSGKNGHEMMQRFGTGGADAPSTYTSSAADNTNPVPLALLAQQNGFLSRHLLQSQSLPDNTTDQSLAQWQVLQKLVVRTLPDASMGDAGFSETGKHLLNKHPQNSSLFDSTLLFKELIGSEPVQHTSINTEPAVQGVKASFAPHINPAYIVDQLLDRINAAARHTGQKISIQLFPPELGKIHIDLALRDNQLRAVVIAESSQVKQMLEAGIDQLRSGLESQNIHLDRLSVMVAGENGQSFERFAAHLRDNGGGAGQHGNTARHTIGSTGTIIDSSPTTMTHVNVIRHDMVDIFV